MRYALVIDKVIVEGPMGLPESWENISGLKNMTPVALADLGWLPYVLVVTAGDIVTSSVVVINEHDITETQITRMRSDADLELIDTALAAEMRHRRNELLKNCDWTMLPDAPCASMEWMEYRDHLRKIPGQAGFPNAIDWPTPPTY